MPSKSDHEMIMVFTPDMVYACTSEQVFAVSATSNSTADYILTVRQWNGLSVYPIGVSRYQASYAVCSIIEGHSEETKRILI